jgi:hypothetical protein
MRLPRVRFTVRRLMVAVAIAAWLATFLPELIGAIHSGHDAYYEWRVLSALSKLVMASIGLAFGLALVCLAAQEASGLIEYFRHRCGAASAPDPPAPE